MKKNVKTLIFGLIAISLVVTLFIIGTFTYHKIQTNKEFEVIKEAGCYNPVSVGDYSLNVAKFGNENGKHTIVGMAGLGMGDCSVSMRQMTECLEEDSLVVFVD